MAGFCARALPPELIKPIKSSIVGCTYRADRTQTGDAVLNIILEPVLRYENRDGHRQHLDLFTSSFPAFSFYRSGPPVGKMELLSSQYEHGLKMWISATPLSRNEVEKISARNTTAFIISPGLSFNCHYLPDRVIRVGRGFHFETNKCSLQYRSNDEFKAEVLQIIKQDGYKASKTNEKFLATLIPHVTV